MIGDEVYVCFFFQAEDGIRDLVRSRGLGDVYKRQDLENRSGISAQLCQNSRRSNSSAPYPCLLYTSDAADDLLCVDHGGRRIIKKKNIP